MTPLRQLALQALRTAVGYAQAHIHEQGNNLGDQVEYWQKVAQIERGASYCAAFVLSCEVKAYCVLRGLLTGADASANRAIMLAHVDAMCHEFHIPRTGYCPTLWQEGVKQGRFHGPDFMPSAGDVVLYQFDSRQEPHHTGMVISATTDALRTVEANTSAGSGGSQDNGQGVYVRARSRDHVFGFLKMGD